MRVLAVGGRTIRVSVREGTAGWPPLLLCNGIGGSLELFQPFVDALDPRRPARGPLPHRDPDGTAADRQDPHPLGRSGGAKGAKGADSP
jgi:hypothetical protein